VQDLAKIEDFWTGKNRKSAPANISNHPSLHGFFLHLHTFLYSLLFPVVVCSIGSVCSSSGI